METLGIFIFLGCGLISLGLISFVETKSQKRFWQWRDKISEELCSISNSLSKLSYVALDEQMCHLKTIAEQLAILNNDIKD